MRWLIIFLIRRRLGVKKYQLFQFKNQKDKHDYYYFDVDCLVKMHGLTLRYKEPSNVSLNWILNCRDELVKFDIYAP